MNCFMKKRSVSNEVIFAPWMNEVLTLPYPSFLRTKVKVGNHLFILSENYRQRNVSFKNQSLINYHTVI